MRTRKQQIPSILFAIGLIYKLNVALDFELDQFLIWVFVLFICFTEQYNGLHLIGVRSRPKAIYLYL